MDSDPPVEETRRRLEERIDARTARIGIVGLGSVGLPLAATFVRAGFEVVGYDSDPGKLRTVENGGSPLRHVPDRIVGALVASRRFTAVADPERLAPADVLVLCLPTPLGPERDPDLSAVEAGLGSTIIGLAPAALVVLESTTYPGTTREVLAPILRRAGRKPGQDVWLAFAPEREDPGREHPTATRVPKLVGGVCETSGRLAERLYAAAFESVRRVSSAEVAEAAKLLENVFRAVNIALVNEVKVALDAMDIDVWEVVEAAATKPFGFMKFTPGPGMGGHCSPIDPFYLAWVARRAGSEAPFVELAGEINQRMPGYVVQRTREALAARGTGLAEARVLLLGLAYKPEVDVVADSPALRLFELFAAAGAHVRYSDPYVPRGPVLPQADLSGQRSVVLSREALRTFDAVVVVTHHAAFDYDLIAGSAALVIDTRNALASRMAGRGNYFKA